MNKITVNDELCKGCYLCMDACPKEAIEVSDCRNASGCYPVRQTNDGVCTACGQCALVCPEAAIEVERDVEED